MFLPYLNNIAIYNILYGKQMIYGSETMDLFLHMIMKMDSWLCKTGGLMDGETRQNIKNVRKYHKGSLKSLDLRLLI